MVKSLYTEAEQIARRAVKTASDRKYDLDQRIDRLVTSPIFGLPIMLLMLAVDHLADRAGRQRTPPS